MSDTLCHENSVSQTMRQFIFALFTVVPAGRLNMLVMIFICDTEQRYKVSGFYLV